MATNNQESPFERVKEFFLQGPEDRKYEEAGGDADVPKERRTADPHADANAWAREQGKDLPYPGHPSAQEGYVNEAPLLDGRDVEDVRYAEAEGDSGQESQVALDGDVPTDRIEGRHDVTVGEDDVNADRTIVREQETSAPDVIVEDRRDGRIG